MLHRTFLELVPFKKVVVVIHFDADKPDIAGTMLLEAIPDGTTVSIVFKNMPPGSKQKIIRLTLILQWKSGLFMYRKKIHSGKQK